MAVKQKVSFLNVTTSEGVKEFEIFDEGTNNLANLAKQTADTAKSTAETAKTSASSADSKAVKAQSTADSALSKANQASTGLNNCIKTASLNATYESTSKTLTLAIATTK